MVGGVFIST